MPSLLDPPSFITTLSATDDFAVMTTSLMTPPASSTPAMFSCDDYIVNVTQTVRAGLSSSSPSHASGDSHKLLYFYITNAAIPLCLFGITGNVLNLFVLTRKQLQSSMDRLEKSVSVGLVALAASDLFFCLLYLVATVVPEQTLYSPLDSRLSHYFKIYQEGLINIFQLASTWLTVNMAVGRYFAICHPLQARGFISLCGTRVAVVCVFIGAVLSNLPRFWHYYSHPIPCRELLSDQPRHPVNLTTFGYAPNSSSSLFTTSSSSSFLVSASNWSNCECVYYNKRSTPFYGNSNFVFGYGMFCSLIGIIVPLVVLTICNVCLILALRRSYRIQSLYRANKPTDSGHRITPTLIALIVLFTILVSPAEFVVFAKLTVNANKSFNLVSKVTNLLLLANYSVNFVLYCVVNAQFRKTLRQLVVCSFGDGRLRGVRGQDRSGRNSSIYCRAAGGQVATEACNISETEIAL